MGHIWMNRSELQKSVTFYKMGYTLKNWITLSEMARNWQNGSHFKKRGSHLKQWVHLEKWVIHKKFSLTSKNGSQLEKFSHFEKRVRLRKMVRKLDHISKTVAFEKIK